MASGAGPEEAGWSTAAPSGPDAPDVPEIIDCIDCGGRCHLLGRPPEDGWRPGDLATYRCADCLDRWDLVVGDE